MRRFRFWFAYVGHYWIAIALGKPLRRAMRSHAEGSFAGIQITDMDTFGKCHPQFVTETTAALQLIRTVDPRRFRTLQCEVQFIVNDTSAKRGSYSRPWRACSVDHRCLRNEQHPEWALWNYATLLIHEATHGAIYSRHIYYSRKLRARIERLCQTEARRFAKRADREDRQWSDALVPPFDERQWHSSWHSSFLQRWRLHRARVREVQGSEQSSS